MLRCILAFCLLSDPLLRGNLFSGSSAAATAPRSASIVYSTSKSTGEAPCAAACGSGSVTALRWRCWHCWRVGHGPSGVVLSWRRSGSKQPASPLASATPLEGSRGRPWWPKCSCGSLRLRRWPSRRRRCWQHPNEGHQHWYRQRRLGRRRFCWPCKGLRRKAVRWNSSGRDGSSRQWCQRHSSDPCGCRRCRR